MALGDKIKIFGNNNFASVAEFARACEVPRESLYKYFKGEVYPGGEFLEKLYKLGCDMNWLFAEEGSVVKEPSVDYKVRDLEKENRKLKKVINNVLNLINSIEEQ